MIVRQAFRFELEPSNAQRTALAKHAATTRYSEPSITRGHRGGRVTDVAILVNGR